MPATLYERGAEGADQMKKLPRTSITPGIVQNNCDLLVQGKVLVRLPSLNQEVWARLTAPGAGNGTGLFHYPNPKDEVLVALIHADPVDAYIIGGMWSTTVTPPIPPVPTNVPTKRVIRTGISSEVGHEIEFDDLLQTITITSAFPPGKSQKIKMEPTGITLTNLAGTISVSADPANPTVSINIEAKAGIVLKSNAYIKLDAPLISMESDGPCVISGRPVKIN
jgi:hypothetical protein